MKCGHDFPYIQNKMLERKEKNKPCLNLADSPRWMYLEKEIQEFHVVMIFSTKNFSTKKYARHSDLYVLYVYTFILV